MASDGKKLADRRAALAQRAFSRLGRKKQLAAELGINAVPNPFEEER